MGTANTRREKSLLVNRMAYERKLISRNAKRKREKVNFEFKGMYILQCIQLWNCYSKT